MQTGFTGTFVISWRQTETDGQRAAAPEQMRVGAVWRWTGDAVRVDGPGGVMTLGDASGAGALRRRAAATVRRLLYAETPDEVWDIEPDEDDEPDAAAIGFQITDGKHLWAATLIDAGPGKHPLCVFAEGVPPSGIELWVVRHNLDHVPVVQRRAEGMVCFAAGTLVRTELGDVPVEQIDIGARVLTKDNGPQEVVWSASRKVTGARLHAMPHLAPVRILTDETEVIVSPDHRMLLDGPAAQTLFGTDEVLVAASDLVGQAGVSQLAGMREVTYHHILLPAHQIIFANGTEAESFHPADGALTMLSHEARRGLRSIWPEIVDDPALYGDFARRCLDRPEALLMHHSAA